jgi:uncharacterized protein YjbI with pentapeptide repeats
MTDPKPPQAQSAEAKKTWFQRLMEKWWGQLLVFAGGLALYLLLGQLLWLRLDLYINPQDSAEKKDLVQALALIMAGVAGVIGIFFTWRGQRITQLAQEANQQSTQAQLKNAQNTLDITRRGQITERFTQAIDQLGKTDEHGKKSLEIRLGAIYSLARTARDSKSDHWPVMEVLTAYVRLHAPRKLEEKESQDWNPEDWNPVEVHPPELDIQAIFSVLRQRSGHDNYVEPGQIDLHDTNLSLANLQKAHLQGAKLREAILQRADLQEADLHGADLQEAHLQGAHLEYANLQRANLQYANLYGANLYEANLAGAILYNSDLQGAYLRQADLQKADLQRADLQANLERANLQEANLPYADLNRAHLGGANLQGAKLYGAKLREANLQGAKLHGADLQEAILRGADLSTSRGLNKEQLEQAVTDEDTLLPKSIQ